ncbi:hypothetical protein [Lacrimispora amygdalina]|nr:hypothetical protein [Clostridium indicum]
MKIEIWSDFVCSFCYMGKTKLPFIPHLFRLIMAVSFMFAV